MAEPRPSADLFLPAAGWKRRVFAFLRFLAFAAVACILTFVPMFLGVLLLRFAMGDIEARVAVQVAAEVLGTLLATAIMARLSGRRLRDFGLGGSERLRNFLIGVATGLSLLSLLLLVLHYASGFSLEPAASAGGAASFYGLFYMLLMLGIAFSEESLCRGYALVALSQSISFWPAAVTMALIFGLMHAFNHGETLPGLTSAALFGLILSYSYRRTRSLWFAYGIHGGWDYAESFIFGVPDSGMTLPGGLFYPRFHGPDWLTGGTAGPEGSMLMIAVLGAMLFVAWKFLRPAGGADALPVPDALAAAAGPG